MTQLEAPQLIRLLRDASHYFDMKFSDSGIGISTIAKIFRYSNSITCSMSIEIHKECQWSIRNIRVPASRIILKGRPRENVTDLLRKSQRKDSVPNKETGSLEVIDIWNWNILYLDNRSAIKSSNITIWLLDCLKDDALSYYFSILTYTNTEFSSTEKSFAISSVLNGFISFLAWHSTQRFVIFSRSTWLNRFMGNFRAVVEKLFSIFIEYANSSWVCCTRVRLTFLLE